MNVHIFIGEFNDRQEALSYTQEYWHPEPADSVSDKEYEEWENNNPKWLMRDDLNCFLDADFIETITDANKFSYLKSIVKEPEKVKNLESNLQSTKSTLILIFDKAIGTENVKMKSTNRIDYKGEFKCVME